MIWYFNDSEKTELLWMGSVYKAKDWNIYKRELTEEELLGLGKGELAEKKAECKRLILERYSETDQQNIQTEAIATGDTVELEEMRAFITAMITEYQTNWKDADYTTISS